MYDLHNCLQYNMYNFTYSAHATKRSKNKTKHTTNSNKVLA